MRWQHDAFTTINAGATEQITFSATRRRYPDDRQSECRNLCPGVDGITFTLGANTQNVTGIDGDDTIVLSSVALLATGILSGGGGADTLNRPTTRTSPAPP